MLDISDDGMKTGWLKSVFDEDTKKTNYPADRSKVQRGGKTISKTSAPRHIALRLLSVKNTSDPNGQRKRRSYPGRGKHQNPQGQKAGLHVKQVTLMGKIKKCSRI